MFAEQLSLYLANRGWKVTVYCQGEGDRPVWRDTWQGVERVHIETGKTPALGSIYFDWLSTRLAAKQGELVLTLGYNTAIMCGLYRLASVPCLINMDGLEWKRDKWSLPARAWLYMNERFGCWFGNRLIADHPEIANHLATRARRERISTIAYGAVSVEQADASLLDQFGLTPKQYAVVIARPEPENSIADIVRAYCRKPRKKKLVILGNYKPEENPFHREVLALANDDVIFPGAIYDAATVAALRFHASLYVHGHQVGGTNPSLVEALGAGAAVLAHDNPFNRWVADDAARYFSDESACAACFDTLLQDDDFLTSLSVNARRRHNEAFVLNDKLAEYEDLLRQWLPSKVRNPQQVKT